MKFQTDLQPSKCIILVACLTVAEIVFLFSIFNSLQFMWTFDDGQTRAKENFEYQDAFGAVFECSTMMDLLRSCA